MAPLGLGSGSVYEVFSSGVVLGFFTTPSWTRLVCLHNVKPGSPSFTLGQEWGVASPTEGRTSQSQSRLARWQLVIGKPHSAPSGAIEVGHLDAQFILAPWVLGLHKQQTQNGELVLITLIQHYCERLFCTTLSLFCNESPPFQLNPKT